MNVVCTKPLRFYDYGSEKCGANIIKEEKCKLELMFNKGLKRCKLQDATGRKCCGHN